MSGSRTLWSGMRMPVLIGLLLSGFIFASIVPVAGADVVTVHLTARKAKVAVAPGVKMRAWTFNGTVPAPVIRAREGDTIVVTLYNKDVVHGKHGGGMTHSVDFHAAEIAPDLNFKAVPPGKKFTFSFVAQRPGVFMYHCGTAPMLEHIGMGMYGMIIIDPAVPRPPAKEITLVQSEFYGSVHRGWLKSSIAAMQNQRPKFMAFNGKAMRYARHPITVPVGQPVRIYMVDAGPSMFSSFHVVGTMFDAYQHDGNPLEPLHNVSTQTVGPGGGAVFELTFPEAGRYPFVDHNMWAMDRGAMGFFQAG